MEIRLTPEHEARLTDFARQQGKDPAAVVEEALAVYLDYQGWAKDARRKIEEGWQQSERGEVVDGETSRRRLDARHAQLLEQSRRG